MVSENMVENNLLLHLSAFDGPVENVLEVVSFYKNYDVLNVINKIQLNVVLSPFEVE